MENIQSLRNQISIQNLKETIQIYEKLVKEQKEYIIMLKKELEKERNKNKMLTPTRKKKKS